MTKEAEVRKIIKLLSIIPSIGWKPTKVQRKAIAEHLVTNKDCPVRTAEGFEAEKQYTKDRLGFEHSHIKIIPRTYEEEDEESRNIQ